MNQQKKTVEEMMLEKLDKCVIEKFDDLGAPTVRVNLDTVKHVVQGLLEAAHAVGAEEGIRRACMGEGIVAMRGGKPLLPAELDALIKKYQMKTGKTKLQELTEKMHELLPELKEHITLEHVLKAITLDDQDYPIHVDFYFDDDGLRITQAKGHLIINKEAVWQLTKPLHEQSEETISFLYKLICNKK